MSSGFSTGSGTFSAMMPAATSLVGSFTKAYGQYAEGNAIELMAKRKSQAAQFEADQLNEQANNEIGAAEIKRTLVARETQLTQSALMARAAASGAGATDPTVVNLVAKNAQEGAYRGAVALYEGEAQARLSRLKAMQSGFESQNVMADAAVAKANSRLAALSTMTSGAAKFNESLQKYWKPPASGTSTESWMGES